MLCVRYMTGINAYTRHVPGSYVLGRPNITPPIIVAYMARRGQDDETRLQWAEVVLSTRR